MLNNRLPWIGTKGDLIQAAKAIRDTSREDMQEASRAIRDELVEFLTGKIDEIFQQLYAKFDERLTVLEQYKGDQMGKFVEAVKNLPAPKVEVSVPPPRLVEKKFTYDSFGRPETVQEKEIS